ncbi:Response regulator [Flavobacterium sp. 9AF]|uniref:response regulator n=1 Tax=Flavobacterium sp. 9AF TaxID=2653142 RepID=UPI0012EFA6D8|nr:response regulator [Flavobacterium sp. 9AF]VXB07979.1 Response regulator [Flavobacterium sp. 9AF]
MFSKVIIAEDIDGLNFAVKQALKELHILEEQIDYAKYCDDALLKIKSALQNNTGFQLLITDLSFKEDYRKDTQKLHSGEELIVAVKKEQPRIKVIAFSIEDRPYRIKSLFEKYDIDAFVMKGRNSIPELKQAITTVFESDKKYVSPSLSHVLQDKTANEIDAYDLDLLKQLSLGITQDEMETKFKELGITPNSKSTIEKRINKLKINFKANNTVHLIAIAKDLGLV